MAIIKCKACGGDLNIVAGVSTAECEYCGRMQTVPNIDDEKKLTLFARANRLRAACDFDKAAGIYESIVADFPEEAEAYWGLVLCKYGIEYVNDPATGKKIPTCHRSSFDSILEDSDFEQAVENSDISAQKIYREEAKEFERIRKGILEVSSTEKPYDIFICYKETDEHGGRTVDSVIAQDLYTALTDKGYRVFFSRITLQGMLGEAYEPYIFAALNSAKVMLAVGSRYEYYNAVWVKNEWSRYIKLCQEDKTKHLIPCYKDLEPEDMPKEFSHLQGADLGKMGAIQDILFNMEKYIPLKQTANVIQERVIVNDANISKAMSLIDRGRMALEDQEWKKADGFFEEALNLDSKNARAYLGKLLAAQKCRTLKEFCADSKQKASGVSSVTLKLEPDQNHINQVLSEYGKTFAEKHRLKEKYQYDLQYTSRVPKLKQLLQDETRFWATDKLLSRVVQFADEQFAAELNEEKQSVINEINRVLRQARDQDAETVAELSTRYEEFLKSVDKQIQELYQQEQEAMLQQLHKLQAAAEKETRPDELLRLAAEFDKLGNLRDSKQWAQNCRNQAYETEYRDGLKRLQTVKTIDELQSLQQHFHKISHYKDATALAKQCADRIRDMQAEAQRLKEEKEQKRIQLQEANRRLAKKLLLIYFSATAVLFVTGIVAMFSITKGDNLNLAGYIGSFIATLVIQVPSYSPALFFLLQALLLGKKDKLSGVMRILTVISAVVGLIVFGFLTFITLTGQGDIYKLWPISTFAFCLLSVLLSFARKRK